MKAVVFGGFGVFGSQVARDLQGAGIDVVICGRRLHGQPIPVAGRFVRADVHDRASCESAIAGAAVAVNCAGPLNPDNLALIEACLAEGVHYTDIADDRGYCARVRAAGPRFAERRLTVGWGLSSLPGISGALAAALHDGVSPRLARVTLFIGNRNPKGHAALASALRMVGAPIAAPQGTLVGFRDFETVEIPPPFGPRRVLNANSADYDVLPALVGAREVRVKVGFELASSTGLFRALAACGSGWGEPTVSVLRAAARGMSWRGHRGGAIVTELFHEAGVRRGSVAGGSDRHTLAARPCSLVAEALCRGQALPRGAVTAWEALGVRHLLDGLAASGFAVNL